jgi:hypothetical protein
MSVNLKGSRGHTALIRVARAVVFSAAGAIGCVLLTGAVQAQTSAVATARQGFGSTAAPVVRRLDYLPQISAAEIAARPQPRNLLTGMTPVTYAARKAQAAAARFALPATAQSMTPMLQTRETPTGANSGRLTPGTDVTIISTGEVACGNVTPADQAIAVGDNPIGVFQAINVCVNVFSKQGVQQAGYPKSFTSFFGLSPSTSTTDPRAIYDWINHRYYMVMIDFSGSQTAASHYNFAVSNSDDPTGGWCLYTGIGVQSLGPSGGIYPLPDFPRMGQDRQAVYIASNLFSTTTTFAWEEILAFPKAQLLNCQSISFQYFDQLSFGGQFTDSTQPVNEFNPTDDPRSEYLITSEDINYTCPCNQLVVWTLAGAVGSQTLSGIGITTTNNYNFPPNASQPGSPNSVDSNDTRISGMAMYSSGSIYASLTTNGGSGQPGIILYQIHPYTNSTAGISSAPILNEIVMSGSNSWFFGTQQPDAEGNVTTVFNFSGTSTDVELAYASRRAAQPVGTIPDGGIILQSGLGTYAQGRWGDYTAVAPAGIAAFGGSAFSPVMWFAGMYARSDGTWGTAIGKNGYLSISDP